MLCEQVVRMANCINNDSGQPLLQVSAVCGRQGWPVSQPGILVSTPAALLNYLYAIDPERHDNHDEDESDNEDVQSVVRLEDPKGNEPKPNRHKDWIRATKIYERSKQYIFVAATLPLNGKKTAGGVLKWMFPDANWVSGSYLHCHNPKYYLLLASEENKEAEDSLWDDDEDHLILTCDYDEIGRASRGEWRTTNVMPIG
ncbi:hypothetical protein IFM89_013201 [Coptis chinensis]|uniref:Uncharacterized protein n=1 Tax=Coptis chinensis TaxID=261450 RepID=A0A835LRP6_9MAGN|nr:hypothetical protein IFM89_013201 [Coptis chinensis]